MKSFVQALQPEAENTVWSTVLIGVETAAVGQTGVPVVTEDEMIKTKASIANKLGRRAFTGGFVLAALMEIGCQVIHLKEV